MIPYFCLLIIICLAFSQLYWGRLPVEPDAAGYQYFTWSDCLSDLHNPVTESNTIHHGIVISASLWLLTEQQYPNRLACTSLTEIAEPCGCILSQETIDLICGSDGHTYLNTCFLDCRKALDKKKITVAHKGVCTEDTQCVCHARYEPICATNGVTYSNECVLGCVTKKDCNIRMKYAGECGTEDDFDDEIKQVGLSQNKNCCCYSNRRRGRNRFRRNGKRFDRCGCVCRNERTEPPRRPANQQICPPDNHPQPQNNQRCPDQNQQQCPMSVPQTGRCPCAALHRPVCGNNHKTYANFCVLHCTARKNPEVKLQYWGDCAN